MKFSSKQHIEDMKEDMEKNGIDPDTTYIATKYLLKTLAFGGHITPVEYRAEMDHAEADLAEAKFVERLANAV